MKQKRPVFSLVRWFYGNYCTRKCYEDLDRQRRHYPKLQELAEKTKGMQMTHMQFLSMLRTDKTICDLSDEEWRNRKFSWKHPDCQLCRRLGL